MTSDTGNLSKQLSPTLEISTRLQIINSIENILSGPFSNKLTLWHIAMSDSRSRWLKRDFTDISHDMHCPVHRPPVTGECTNV